MTIKEIAKLSGVSVSTVSRYLNEGYVSEEKRKIISKVVEENNYERSDAALSLRNKSREIVVIVQRVSSNTASRFLDGIITRCSELNINVLIQVANFDEELQAEYITKAIKRNVLGIIVYSFTENIKIKDEKILVVGQKSNELKSIYSNGRQIYNELVTNVLKKNQKQISTVNILGIEIMDIEFINRVAGAIDAVKKYNLDYQVSEDDFTNISTKIKMEKGTYYVCLTDAQAYAVIQKTTKLGLVIGHDIFVSGYGNYSTSELLELTSVDGLYEYVGELAIDTIVEKKEESLEITPKIIYRSSTNEKIYKND